MDLALYLAISLAMEDSIKWMGQFNVWKFKECQWKLLWMTQLEVCHDEWVPDSMIKPSFGPL